MENFTNKIKKITGIAVVAFAGVTAGQSVEAKAQVKAGPESLSKVSESGVENIKADSSSLFIKYKKDLNQFGIDDIEILRSSDPKKIISGTVSAEGMTTFVINFLKQGNKVPELTTTLMVSSSEVSNKYSRNEVLDAHVLKAIQKMKLKSAPEQKNMNPGAPTKGRIIINGKDVTPDGTGSGPMSLETINGVLHINGKSVKK